MERDIREISHAVEALAATVEDLTKALYREGSIGQDAYAIEDRARAAGSIVKAIRLLPRKEEEWHPY